MELNELRMEQQLLGAKVAPSPATPAGGRHGMKSPHHGGVDKSASPARVLPKDSIA